MPNYSVVATTYNDADEILKYLENICGQSEPPAEVIIVDGGSQDNTVSIIENYALNSLIPIHAVRGGRLNISQGYNEAIRHSKSRLIGITGIGNYYEKDFFQKLLSKQIQEDCDVTYSPVRGWSKGAFSEKYNNTILHGEKGQRLPIASNHGALVKREIFESLGFFYEDFIYAGEDTEFYSLVAAKGYKSARVENAFVYWFTPTSYSEYFRQLKNYAIAELQIHNDKVLFRNTIVVILPALLAAVLVRTPLYLFFYLGTVFLFVLILALKFHKEKKSIILWLCNKFLPFFCYLKYGKYSLKKYRVKR